MLMLMLGGNYCDCSTKCDIVGTDHSEPSSPLPTRVANRLLKYEYDTIQRPLFDN